MSSVEDYSFSAFSCGVFFVNLDILGNELDDINPEKIDKYIEEFNNFRNSYIQATYGDSHKQEHTFKTNEGNITLTIDDNIEQKCTIIDYCYKTLTIAFEKSTTGYLGLEEYIFFLLASKTNPSIKFLPLKYNFVAYFIESYIRLEEFWQYIFDIGIHKKIFSEEFKDFKKLTPEIIQKVNELVSKIPNLHTLLHELNITPFDINFPMIEDEIYIFH